MLESARSGLHLVAGERILNSAKLRDQREEREELDAILPWGLGAVIDTFANTLDEIISEAFDPGADSDNSDAEHTEKAPPVTPSTTSTLSSTSPSSSTHWNISWNDIFGDDTEEDEAEGRGEDVYSAASSSPQHGEEGHAEEDVQKLHRELRRYKRQNGQMKKRIAALEAQLEQARLDDARPDTDEVMTMQIEHLLAQKSKLGYENDSLKRENTRLEELVDYFLGTARLIDEDDASGDTTDSFSIDS